jgi:hypothetical protein
MVPSQRVVATCRLPWQFRVGKRQGGQGAPTAPADGTLPSQNGAGSPSGLHPIAGDTSTPRPCAGVELRVPSLAPTVLTSPGSSPLSEREHQVVSLMPSSYTQAPAGRCPGANVIVGPTQLKRSRAEAGLDDGDSQDTIRERRVRPRLEPRSTSTAGLSAPPTNHSYSRAFTTAADPGVTQGTTPHGIPSSNGSLNSPATSASPSASQPDPLLRPVQGHQGSAQPVESITTVLRATNPRTGPVSGGIEVWLAGEDLPMTFTLYARFGTHVTATVSSIFHLYPSPLIFILDGSESGYIVMCTALHKLCRPCEGYTIPFSLSWSP